MIEFEKKDISFDIDTCNKLVYLVACVINEEIPEKNKLENIDFNKLYDMAKRQSLLSICCMSIESADGFNYCTDEILVKKWKDGKNKTIRKNIMLDSARNEICSFMDEAGIWYMPLKGIILKEMYPKLGMRQMSDNDILFNVKYQNELKSFMLEHGYIVESFGKGNHDVYMKKPVYNFEMHTALYGIGNEEKLRNYYKDVKKRLIKDDDNEQGYHFTNEDFYIHILSHAYKHFSGSGTGIRSILDVYVMLKHMEKILDWDYVKEELKKLGIAEFEKEMRELSRKMFLMKNEKLSGKEKTTLEICINSGTYGTMKNSVQRRIQKIQQSDEIVNSKTKRKYWLKRLFPDKEYYIKNHPFVYKHKWMIPIFLPYRWIHGIVINGKRIIKEIKIVHKI